uniref:ATP-binding protein n=1 Tax=Lachnoclostridium phocaeense TaxID=1871021 RepID=UPI0026DDA338|nr:transporter substrate-binding domain-containing protein [Lachnoclostridium phocaeense]
MKEKKWTIGFDFVLWFVAMLVFLWLMADQYCHMMYGGNLFYVLSGNNEITEEEREFLKGQGPLIYGETLDSFPAQIYDESLQEENGFAIDLMEQMEWELGADMTFQAVEWPEVFDKLEQGEVDVIQISYSEERAEKYYLTAPVYRNRGVVFMENTGAEVTELKELKGRKLAGIKEDYALLELEKKCPGADVVECDNIAECAQLLREKQVDGIVADEQNLMYYMQGEKLFQDYYMVEENVYEADVVFAVRKSDEELGKILDKAVYQMRNKDVLEKIQKKWFLTSVLYEVPPREVLYFWGIVLVVGIAAFYIWLFGYIHMHTRTLVKQRTKELERERVRVQRILDSIPQYVLEVSPEGRVVMANQHVRQALSDRQIATCDEEGMKIQERQVMDILDEIPEKSYVCQEVEIGERWYRIIGSSILGKQESENRILVAEDITLSRIHERKNRQNEKMIAIGQLASGISHELKNPLEIICNYCYALKKGILHTPEEVADTVQVIEEEAESANKIVESLLSFARMAPGDVSDTELKPVLENILRIQEPVFRKKKIQVTCSCEDDLAVRCNPEGIKMIIINLLTNGAEAIEAKGEAGSIEITAVREMESARVEIRDTGKGMSEQEIEKIFNPFYTTKVSGTGLGLYLVYQQIHEMGGEIQVSSREGEGSLFRIYFPLSKEEGEGIDEYR